MSRAADDAYRAAQRTAERMAGTFPVSESTVRRAAVMRVVLEALDASPVEMTPHHAYKIAVAVADSLTERGLKL